MSGYVPILDLLDGMITDTAERANTMALADAGFDAIGAGAGVAVRLKALQDARAAVVVLGLREHEAAAVCDASRRSGS